MTFSKSIATRHKESFFKVEESDKKWKEGSVDFNITRYFIYFSVDYFFKNYSTVIQKVDRTNTIAVFCPTLMQGSIHEKKIRFIFLIPGKSVILPFPKGFD